ncbi:Uncharacterised protein [Mycobacteroides abscessus subsp. abscessus]|nr:Uncharacterised protein [Mycobacteroides abscessus subsp. abscessus]
MAAVLVPPSACSTSQSMAMVFSPIAARSMQARNERPTSLLISWVRPPTRPLTDSRPERVWVAAGNIAYSAVSQPSPESRRQAGTPSVTLAVHITRVCPNSTSTEPAGCVVNPRVILTSRSSSSALPSARLDTGQA